MLKAEQLLDASSLGPARPRTRADELWTSLLSELLSTKMIPPPGNYLVRSERRWASSGAAIFKITVTLSFRVEQISPASAAAVHRLARQV